MYIDKLIKKEIVTLITSLIILLTVFIGVSFAAFFSIDEGKDNTISLGDLEILFCDDITCKTGYENIGQIIGMNSNNEIVTMYPYKDNSEAINEVPYIFNIKNTGNLDINLTSLLTEDITFVPSGEYKDYESLTTKYKSHIMIGLNECNEKINRENVNIFKYEELTNNILINKQKLKSGEDKTYCLWTWLDNKAPNEVQKTFFVANLNFEAEYSPKSICADNTFPKGTLKYKMLNDNCATKDTQRSEYVTKIGGIDYSKINSETNGLGLYYTEDENKTFEGKRVYFYRGDVKNNNLVLENNCYKILRTNEDGSIKIMYSGKYIDNKCETLKNEDIIYTSYNNSNINNKYIGYMFGENSETYENTHKNITSSSIKNSIEQWYKNNILIDENIHSKIYDTVYCNDRMIANISSFNKDKNTKLGYSQNETLYSSIERINESKPIFKCIQSNDRFTVTNNLGNMKLKYPVGLITIDELIYAGANIEESTDFYLNYNIGYWTMSSYGYNDTLAKVFAITSEGKIKQTDVMQSNAILPVISLKEDIKVNGSGTIENPYIVE